MKVREIEIVGCLEYVSLKVDIIYFVHLKNLLLADLLEGENVPLQVDKGDGAVGAAP